MTLNSSLLQNSISSSNNMTSSVNSTTSLSDLTSSRYNAMLGNSTRHSPLTDSLPGPSGIGPVQHAPLVRIFKTKNHNVKSAHAFYLIPHFSFNKILFLFFFTSFFPVIEKGI